MANDAGKLSAQLAAVCERRCRFRAAKPRNAGVVAAKAPGALEKELDRSLKKVLNEPRSLDLDLIAFGSEIRNTQELVLPHPRAHLRRFVLQPLSEIAPDLILPGQSKTVVKLLAGLPDKEIVTRLDTTP